MNCMDHLETHIEMEHTCHLEKLYRICIPVTSLDAQDIRLAESGLDAAADRESCPLQQGKPKDGERTRTEDMLER